MYILLIILLLIGIGMAFSSDDSSKSSNTQWFEEEPDWTCLVNMDKDPLYWQWGLWDEDDLP